MGFQEFFGHKILPQTEKKCPQLPPPQAGEGWGEGKPPFPSLNQGGGEGEGSNHQSIQGAVG